MLSPMNNGRLDRALLIAIFAAIGGLYWQVFSMNGRLTSQMANVQQQIAEVELGLTAKIAEVDARLSAQIAEVDARLTAAITPPPPPVSRWTPAPASQRPSGSARERCSS